MKLKLETKAEITVLAVTESIGPSDVAVLKAGLGKLFEGGKKVIVLDLTQISEALLTGEKTALDLAELPGWAVDADASLAIASSIPKIATAPSLEEALSLVKSPSIKLLAEEARLRARIQRYTEEKAELEKQFESVKASGDLKTIQKEQSDLRRTQVLLERWLQSAIKTNPKPYTSDLTSAQNKTLSGLIEDALKQQGISIGNAS